MKKIEQKFDVAVIGGGPAGMMAAARAASLGRRVVLLEKNRNLGKKLLMTGKGRCNVTQARDSNQEFIERLGKKGRFLFSSLNAFDAKAMISFLKKRGIKTKTERGGRVFPISDKAGDVLRVLRNEMTKHGVEMRFHHKISGFGTEKGIIKSVKFGRSKILAKKFILCTGGKSHPATGSTGDGYCFVRKLGHTIIPPKPALVPIRTREKWTKDAEGLSLKNVGVSVFQNGKKEMSRFGESLFTDVGLSGPIIIDLSREIGELLKKGKVFIQIDLKPALDFQKLDKKLQREFLEKPKKDFKNYLETLLPKKIISTILLLSKINPQKKLCEIGKDQRKNLVHLLKELELEVESLMEIERAVITAGGVSLKEIDSKTMQSRKIKNLFFAGEIIDLDGPTGGYNLQICWSTGFCAGSHAVK